MDGPEHDPWRLRQRPENEVPVPVHLDAVLAEADGIVVVLCGARVYTTGLEFTVVGILRETEPDLHWMFHQHGPSTQQFLLGVEFADGRRTTTIGDPVAEDPASDRPMLTSGGGGGNSRRTDASFFLSPLPPAGILRFVAAWPFRGITDQVVEIDTAEILEAASRVRVLWPWTPEEYPEPEPPAPPDLPADSWFLTARPRP